MFEQANSGIMEVTKGGIIMLKNFGQTEMELSPYQGLYDTIIPKDHILRRLKENIDFAYFDEPLWILLQNKVWRTKLRDYIVEHKLTDNSWLGKLAAEGFGTIAAIMIAA